MTDAELIERLQTGATWDDDVAAANRIEALTAERDEVINQLDSVIHSQIVLGKRTAAVMEDRALILAERDRTFALMLARAEKAEADNSRLRDAIDYILDGMGIYEPYYIIDPDDDFLDAANSEWVRDTLERLASALTGKETK